MDKRILDILEKQEAVLRFDSVSYSDLCSIGQSIVEAAEVKGASVYVLIRLSGDIVFAYAMDGTSRSSIRWAERKANTAEISGKSSMRDGAINREKGRSLPERGLDPLLYTEEGGAFPILLSSGAAIGSVAVSGMTSEEDHQLVVDALSSFLGRKVPSVID